jgi:hypothetical protein
VVEMREGKKMSFPAIAELLNVEGVIGVRGATLDAKGAYSIYKKRKAHLLSRTSPIQYQIRSIKIYSRTG